jgi:hypothetical protein
MVDVTGSREQPEIVVMNRKPRITTEKKGTVRRYHFMDFESTSVFNMRVVSTI